METWHSFITNIYASKLKELFTIHGIYALRVTGKFIKALYDIIKELDYNPMHLKPKNKEERVK